MSAKSASQSSGDAKRTDLERDTVAPGETLTTNQGLPIGDDQNSLKAGVRGPTLLEDFHLREKLTHFDHERIPERVVHARGAAAHGYFECTHDASDITMASPLKQKGKRTPVFLRFSTVAGSRGSADTPRDVRGFAVKFYTDEGVWDLVGNNVPVFFIQDAIKFPDVVHAVKPEPHNEMPQAASAHDTFWDFVSLTPESTHMLMWKMSDRTLPRSFSMMEGFGVHSFRFINSKGESHFVKFHFKPVKGVFSMVWDESQKVAGKDPDFNRRDLFDAIERGDFPEWTFGVQVVAEKDEHKFDFDLLDPTKIIPEELVPVRPLGRLVLNRNPDNFFAETEQVAFHPGHIIRGIDFTNDPLLQGRLFSYIDTQIKRVGPNFAQLPINRPTCPFSNNQRDGESQQLIHKGRVSYFPNSLAKGCPAHAPDGMKGFHSYQEKIDAHKIRQRSESFADHFSQATLFYNSMSQWEKNHIVSAFSFELNQCTVTEVKQRVIDELLVNVSTELAGRVAKNIGLKVSKQPKVKPHDRKSPALSMDKPVPTLKGRKVAILAAPGAEARSLKSLISKLKSAEGLVKVIAPSAGTVQDSDGTAMEVHKPLANAPSVIFDAVFVAGGSGATSLAKNPTAVQFISDMKVHGKPIGAIGEAKAVLTAAGVDGAFEKQVQTDDGIVTTSGDDFDAFASAFVEAMKRHRFPDRQPETFNA